MADNSEYSHSGLALFAAELQAARAKAGLSQDELAGRINYSPSTVAMIENLKRVPRPEFAEGCDRALGTPGTFARLQQHARTTALPSWFRQYAEIEAAASQLRLVEQRVTARLGRQDILDGDDPPRLWVVIDEAVLHRQVHGAAVMAEQLLHLAEMSLRPNVIIEVLPFDAEAYYSLLGAFAIADIGDGSRVAYLETVIEGYVVENPSVVADIMYLFDSLRSEALSPGRSRDLIMKRAEKYGPYQGGLAQELP